ncbi:hypothetical protein [uncultured Fluviicola sp.]|uniref:hypothetical protein n=1 Tax=uncultured Fluviicola sp. TaxID=463303 RepID=UPI0025DEA122|nr:hypothetical protein [uncultured Fluviicola sp.]
MTIRYINSIIIILICAFFFGIRSCNKYYDSLSGTNIRIGVANVYDSYSVKGGTHYKYIYKIGSNYYTESTNADCINDLSEFPIQSFLIVYNKKRPYENVLICEKPLGKTLNLDTLIDQSIDLGDLIKKNTLLNDNATSADLNDKEEKNIYFRKTR